MLIGIRLTYRADTAATVTQLYKPWGEVRYSSGTLPTDYILPCTQDRLFTGQYSHTDDFGLMYYNTRWYDPVLGRMAQVDSIVRNPYNPLAYDHYAYTYNNPVKYTDSSGHCIDSSGNMIPNQEPFGDSGPCDGGGASDTPNNPDNDTDGDGIPELPDPSASHPSYEFYPC